LDACVQHPEALPGHDAALADIDGSPTTRRQGQQGGRLQEPSAMITRRHGFSRLIGQVWEPPWSPQGGVPRATRSSPAFRPSSVTSKDFADPLGKPPPGIIPVAVKLPESCLGFACW